MDPAISAAAHQLASAEAAHAAARERLAEAQAEPNRVDARQRQLEQRRAAMIERRARGDHRPGDAAELALMDSDLQGLASIAAELAPAVAAARRSVEGAVAVVANARLQLQRTEAEVTERRLAAHAAELETAFLETLRRLSETSAGLQRHRPAWKPSSGLMTQLRRIELLAGA